LRTRRTGHGSSACIARSITQRRDVSGAIDHRMDADSHAGEERAATGAAAWQDPNFAAVFEHAAIGMAIVDMEGRPVHSNPALQRILGCSGEELAAMVFTDFTHPDDVSADWELFEELFDGRRDHYQLQKRYVRKDGQVIWGQLAVSVVRDDAGRPSYGIGMVNDVTERKHAEEALVQSEARFRTILEAAPAAAIVLDAKGRIALVNDQTERL